MKTVLLTGLFVANMSVLVSVAAAQDLVFTPTNPSFGGNPLNSGHLLSIASAQRTATARDAETSDGSGTGGSTELSTAEQFVRQLESRIYSQLASDVVNAIFGEDPQDEGSVVFGTQTVDFINTGSELTITITDSANPLNSTEITVPVFN